MSASTLLTRLLDYIIEQDKEVDPHAFKLSRHKGFMRAKSDLQALPGVDFDLKPEGDHVWLRVSRLEAARPPALPDALRGIVELSDDPFAAAPSLDEAAFERRLLPSLEHCPLEERAERAARDRERIEHSLADYAALWTAWAKGEKPRRQSISLYADLFALKHQLEADETAKPHELVWGIGVSAWKLPFSDARGSSTIDFQFPLLTQALELALDDRTLALEVRPRSVDPRCELDAFAACDLQGTAEVDRVMREALARSADRPVTPFDPGSFEYLLRLVAGNLHEKGRFEAGGEGFPSPGDDLVVSDGWVLLARPRANNYLHEDIERLKRCLRAGDTIPGGAEAMVTSPSDEAVSYEPIRFRGLSSGASAGGAGGVRELYFPLPYNDEQVTIVEQLERSSGVAVQGPPGTGKTHTIANIVCHYLALGKKVLVTSKGEQALEVLQSKMPESVRPLTVALLSGDREGMRQFQISIEAIIHHVSQLNVDVAQDQINNDQSAIERAHAELSSIDRRVNAIALSQLSHLELDGVELNALKMAELVLAGSERHSWFDDTLSLAAAHAPPLDGQEAAALRESRRRLGLDLVYGAAVLPASAALLPAADVGRLHRTLVDLRDIDAAQASGALLALRALTPDVLVDARELHAAIDAALVLVQQLEETNDEWPFQLRHKCKQVSFSSERAALEALFADVAALSEARAAFLRRPVEVPASLLELPRAREAIARAAETGKPFGMFALGVAELREQLASVRVAGLEPGSAEDWQHVQRYAQLHERVLSFSARWNELAGALALPKAEGGVARLREIESVAVQTRRAHELATEHDPRLVRLAQRVFARPPVELVQGVRRDLADVRDQLRLHLIRAEFARALTELATLQEQLAGTSGPIALTLRAFVDGELGDTKTPEERVVARYSELVAEVRRIEGLAHDLGVVSELASRIEQAGAPRLAARVRTRPVEGDADDRVFPSSWREAWTWARLKSHLDEIEGRAELQALAARRRDLERGLAKLYESLVSRAAWLSTKRNASPRVLSALETYRTAIRRIGKGTGPNAIRHRRDAQRAMLDAQAAVPCWVMSHAKVSETLPAQLGCFDLVIVDEASQSDLWSLPAVLRGKKILVVGDDKQVSPDAAFVSATQIQELKDRFLGGQPYATVLTPEKSLYDLASTVFAAHKVMLREHFRCVPPIIAYSNRTFYEGFIQPLRIPPSSERIDPPLVDIFVEGGARDARDVNEREAEAILEEICAILDDRRFDGKTLGVVSLLGIDQAKRIDRKVRDRCDAGELHRRRFKCGDARLFQGSERDIMFLSLVADRDEHKALSGNMFEQRFNVAASRARDRLYLVRSVHAGELSATDNLRLRLIDHFQKPLSEATDEAQSLIDQCESRFEQEVYGALCQRGYRVVPQVKAGAFRIDLVVEGEHDTRLAIECDGDDYHGPDRWPHDMRRQRALERAGWTFWRCFASTWALHREEVFRDLLTRLSSMGIEPLGALESAPSLVEHRVWRESKRENDGEDPITAVLEAATGTPARGHELESVATN
jgi:very-short-patch-repair endonuclease